jgi:Domain of unknown function (DUF4194)
VTTTRPEPTTQLSTVVISLLKGVVYRDTHERAWTGLHEHRHQVADHLAVLGLEMIIDETEGYAYLRTVEAEDDQDRPRLIARHALSFPVSLLLALLRRRLAEFDATSAEVRLVLTRAQIAEMLRLFLPETSNEVRLLHRIDAHVNKVVDLGFLRPLRGAPDTYEVRRIIKAYVDGQWLAEFDRRLAEYADQVAAEETS